MDENAVDARPAATAPESAVIAIDSVEVAAFSAVVARLTADYPAVSSTRIEGILLREWEAFSAGRPLVVPVAVEAGVREILDQR
ncbi:three-helix bundle dimerization domain-containing protein [Microbacterium sp. NPDC091313]